MVQTFDQDPTPPEAHEHDREDPQRALGGVPEVEDLDRLRELAARQGETGAEVEALPRSERPSIGGAALEGSQQRERWRLDTETIEVGRRGLARARAALRESGVDLNEQGAFAAAASLARDRVPRIRQQLVAARAERDAQEQVPKPN